jgi:hypothetical protein
MRTQTIRRRGSVLPFVAMSTVMLVSMLALAIDIGMVAIAKTQCQNAADSAATAAARTLNGNSTGNYNLANVPVNGIAAATANKLYTQNITGNSASITTLSGSDGNGNSYAFQSGNVTIKVGAYTYVYNDTTPSAEGFQLTIPTTDVTTNQPYGAVQATVTGGNAFFFAKIFGLSSFTTTATAVSINRPRDVVIVLDLSGSMRFQSLPGLPLTSGDIFGDSGTFAAASSSSSPRVVSMNPDTVIPTFGHYSNTASAALIGSTIYQESTGEMTDLSNISSTQNSGPPICADFYSNAAGTAPSSSNVAFTAVAASGTSAPPSGDNYLGINSDTTTPPTTYGSTVQSITGGYSFWGYRPTPYQGYKGGTVANYNGYTQGPGYWGKTKFIWPPDPRPATVACTAANYANNGSYDWRQRFFLKYNTGTSTYGWLDHNSILFNPSGSPATQASPNPTPILNVPMGTSGGTTTTVYENGVKVTYAYKINYAAILFWLFDSSITGNPSPFPSTLQGGRIRYYSSIPNYNDTTLNSRWWAASIGTSGDSGVLSDVNERFWKDYIDFVLGVQGYGSGMGSAATKDGQYSVTQNSVPYTAFIGNGDMYSWGTVQIGQKPGPGAAAGYNSAYIKGTVNVAGGLAIGATTVTIAGATNQSNSKPDAPAVGDTVTFGASNTQYTITASTVVATTGAGVLTISPSLSAAVANSASVNIYPYMSYTDNPYRPRHQFWFGPMTMVDYLGNYNLITGVSGNAHHWWPGNCHESHAWACKVGIQTAINDIQNNHPNDFVAMAFFSTPKTSLGGYGHHNRGVVPMGRSYTTLTNSLWFPPLTVTGGFSEITPYDNSLPEGPRADGGTAVGMGFMLAYNQLSNSAANLRFYSQPSYKLPSSSTPNYRGDAGGLGRKGAARLVIFETDGFPNSRAVSSKATSGVAGLSGSGSDSYFPIRIYNPANMSDSNNVEWPTAGSFTFPSSCSEIYTQVQAIVAQQTASPPGFSTVSRPVLVHCIGYGSIFDPTLSGTAATTARTDALTFLQTVQFYGNTSTNTNPASFPSWKQIYGTNANRISTMQTAFTNIMQSEVQISLLQ